MIPRDFIGAARPLSGDGVAAAAQRLGCSVAAVRAVLTVETGGTGGFLADGRPRILFEAHLFSRATGGRYDRSHPAISSPVWNRALYRGGAGEYPRLDGAMRLDRTGALSSASWGMFQVLGSNARSAGYPDPEAFVEAMCVGEDEHLAAFVSFCISVGLDDELRRGDWTAFARGYNGPGYAANRYDVRLAQAFRDAGGGGSSASGAVPTLRIGATGPAVKALQDRLNRVAAARLEADGVFGRVTEIALQQWQQDAGLPVTGTGDAATLAALGLD